MPHSTKDVGILRDSSAERLRVSLELRTDLQNCVRKTKVAISTTQFLIAQTNEIIDHLPRAAQSSRDPIPAVQTNLELPHSDALHIISGQNFRNELVPMDCRHFVDCTMTDCTLEYSGQPVVLETTSFSRCTFRFGGEAAMTACFLDCFGLLTKGNGSYTLAASHPNRSILLN